MRRLISILTTFKAKLRGGKVGKNSIFGFGYDWVFSNWKGVSIGPNVLLGRRAWVQTTNKNARVSIGAGCSIGRDVVISAANSIVIDEGCLFSYRVSILDHDHAFELGVSPVGSKIGNISPVVIGARSFLGANVTVLKGTTIGHDCIVGANSVVKGKFPPESIIVGNPARVIGNRNAI